ncbi:21862_t:CDS:2 [Cetraspora pellucida]|uniref:21862_t:CDS:1 n=1 Tax=Cetraspora pellucida TaxID=1433469 RepID=A0A9N8VKJ3_9GLOM|nr:21862_t:CDS:2 [Cetraspora pellucida]
MFWFVHDPLYAIFEGNVFHENVLFRFQFLAKTEVIEVGTG